MSGRTRSNDPFGSEPAATAPGDSAPQPSAPRLELALVRYDDRPDRCTIHPPETTGVERMSTWLSVDRSLVVDVASMR